MKGVTYESTGRAGRHSPTAALLVSGTRKGVRRTGRLSGSDRTAGGGGAAVSFGTSRRYLERDVRAITEIRDSATFRRFLSLVATRCGQMLNKTDLAAPLGVSVPTISGAG